jgi:hypothetical protein
VIHIGVILIPPIPLEWALVVVLALALGLELYLTILVLALLGYLPVEPAHFGQLELLASPWIILTAFGLLALSWWVEERRGLVPAWELFHVPARIAAASLLALLVVGHPGMPEPQAPTVVAGIIAGGVQTLRIGWGVILTRGVDRAPSPRTRRVLEGVTAVALLAVAAIQGAWAAPMGAGLILLLLLGTCVPPLRAAAFTLHLIRGQLRDLVGSSEWRPHVSLPRWIRRRLVDRAGVPVQGARGVRAALMGVSQAGFFRSGWLILGPEGPLFMYRTTGQIWAVDLFRGRPTLIRAHPELVRVDWRDEDGRFHLFLPRSIQEEEFRELADVRGRG